MNTRNLTILGVAVVLLALAATFISTKPETLRRSCGDPHDFSSLVSRITGLRFGPTHCCYANSMIADLKQIGGAMETYRIENATYPTSFDPLTNYISDARSRFVQYRLQSDGKHWTVTVPQHPGLPGHYLLTDEGDHLYFNPAGPATTNDLDLFKCR
jgi:hypothetical protein